MDEIDRLRQQVIGLRTLMSWLIVELTDKVPSFSAEYVAEQIAGIERSMVLHDVQPATIEVLSHLLRDLEQHLGVDDPNEDFRARLGSSP